VNTVELHNGDCLDVLRGMESASVDSIVTDPPYGLSFMGKRWDYDVPSVEIWAECLRVLKPGGHLLAFAGTRTQHRMAVRIEDAGFEIRDMIAWVYGSGFPKSLDVSKAIDKLDATEARQARRFKFTEWMRSTGLTAKRIDDLTGTCMGNHYTTHPTQPAIATREHLEALRDHIPFEVPGWVEALVDERTVESENFKRREVVGVAEMRDTSEVRIAVTASADDYDATARREVAITAPATDAAHQWQGWGTALKPALEPITVARKPLAGTVAENVLAHGTGALNIDGCRVEAADGDEVVTFDRHAGDRDRDQYRTGTVGNARPSDAGRWPANLIHDGSEEPAALLGDSARFFYCAKASRKDRNEGCEGMPQQMPKADNGAENAVSANRGSRSGPRENHHPTVKPTELMRYLCRLVTPPGGVVLDPFTGSGSTGKAAILEGFRFIGIEREAEYVEIARARIAAANPPIFGEVA
jgi:DNA modification methylase